jgi:hypothetical protein
MSHKKAQPKRPQHHRCRADSSRELGDSIKDALERLADQGSIERVCQKPNGDWVYRRTPEDPPR